MSDDRIRAVLARAAEDRTFSDALMADRESALGAFDLSPEEKTLLMAPTRAQLRRMVDAVRKKPFFTRGRMAAYAGVGAAAALGFSFFATVTATAGVSREVGHALHARSVLKAIAVAEARYKNDFGSYAGFEDLKRAQMIVVSEHVPYDYAVEWDGDTFTATARHRTRPDTRRAFRVGPDGEVKPLE